MAQRYSHRTEFVSLLDDVMTKGSTRLIRTASYIASQPSHQQHQKYFILLIITGWYSSKIKFVLSDALTLDGVFVDMRETIDVIVEACSLPLSV